MKKKPNRGVNKGKMGRPRLVFTEEQVKELRSLAQAGATQREMADKLGVDEKTLRARILDTSSLAQVLKEADSSRRVAIRRKRLQIAMEDGHPAQATMIIWLSKVDLGESERVTVKFETETEVMDMLQRMFPTLSEDELRVMAGEMPTQEVH